MCIRDSVKALLRRTTNAQEESQIAYENILVDNDKHAVYVDGKPVSYTHLDVYKRQDSFSFRCSAGQRRIKMVYHHFTDVLQREIFRFYTLTLK